MYFKEWTLPSRLGAEKELRNDIRQIIAGRRIEEEKLENMLTAVTEACLNAIEHGNLECAHIPVSVILRIYEQKCTFWIYDQRRKRTLLQDRQYFDIHQRWEAVEPRGWGLFLIRQLADSVQEGTNSKGSYLALTFQLPANQYEE